MAGKNVVKGFIDGPGKHRKTRSGFGNREAEQKEENKIFQTTTWLQWCDEYIQCAIDHENCKKMIQHKKVVRKRIATYLERIKKTKVLLKDVDKDLVSGLFAYMREYRNSRQIKTDSGG